MTTPERPSEQTASFTDVSSGRVAYYEEGRGVPAIAIHGLPGSARDFRWFAPVISERCRFIRVDMPGFGETPLATMPKTSVADRAQFVVDVAKSLGLDRYVLLGHSMGGAVAAKAAELAGDRVSGLALISSIGGRPHRLYRQLGWSWRVVPFIRGRFAERLAQPILKKMFAQGGFRGPYADGAELHTMRCIHGLDFAAHAATVEALRIPTFMSYCTDDPLIEVEIFDDLADRAPKGPRFIFPNGAHNPQKAHAVELGVAMGAWIAAR